MVETAHLVHICRWTAPQPHEATRSREFLEVNESKGNTVAAWTAASGRTRPDDVRFR